MTPERQALLSRYFEHHLGPDWQAAGVRFLDGQQTTQALWVHNAQFKTHHAAISSIAYSPAHEAEADRALEALAFGAQWTASNPSPATWRVLMERHIQALQVALANELANNPKVVPIPRSLAPAQQAMAAVLFLQWAMVLPWPAADRSGAEWPPSSLGGSLRQQ